MNSDLKILSILSLLIVISVGVIFGVKYTVLLDTKSNYIAESMVTTTFNKQSYIYYEIIFDNIENPFELNMKEFSYKLDESYYLATTEMINPCQFYSYIWARYLEYNNIDYKYVVIPNHIFVIAYLENSYVLLDQIVMQEVIYS